MQHPNILLLFSDQHQAAVLGAEGHPDVLTPSLDRLAASGTRFTRAYCQDGICVASRASLFSGLYPRTLGVRSHRDRSTLMMNETVSLPLALQRAGYRTAAFGKRHLHGTCDAGWDIKLSHFIRESDGESYTEWIDRRGQSFALDIDWAAEWGAGMADTPRAAHELPFVQMSVRPSMLPDTMTMEAWTKQQTVEFLRRQRKSRQPFFCYSSFYRPHQPYTPLPAYYNRFDRSRWGAGRLRADGLAAPATLRQPAAQLPPLLQEWRAGSNRVWRLDLAARDEQLYRDYLAAYYALVEEIDTHIGDILACLEETGQLGNTIIIYTSDHGDFVGAHGMAEKCAVGQNVYEETLRVPLLIAWDGRVRPQVSTELAELVDLYPTVLDLAGVSPSAGKHPLQGQSIAAHLTDGQPVGKPFIVSENWTQSTVITPTHKLGVWQPPADPRYAKYDYRSFGDMLFARADDPHEQHNLIHSPAHAAIAQQLRARLAEWQTRVPANPADLPPAEPSA